MEEPDREQTGAGQVPQSLEHPGDGDIVCLVSGAPGGWEKLLQIYRKVVPMVFWVLTTLGDFRGARLMGSVRLEWSRCSPREDFPPKAQRLWQENFS